MIGLLLLVTCALACAQEPNGTRATLGVADAVAAALAGHPALSAAGHLEVAAQAGLRAARARANPEVVIAPTLLGSQGTPEAVSISQPLEVNGARRARVRVATAATQAAAAEREVLARGLALRVRTAYWDAVLAQASVEVERQNVDYARTLVEAATLQVNLGNQPRMHQMKAEVEVARGQQQLIAAQERAALTMAALCGAMGQAPGTNYRLADPLGFGPAAFDEAQLLAGALAARPEVRLAQADVEAADGEAEQTRLARRPDVALTYWQETFDATGGLGVSVSLPVLDWGGQKQRESQVRSLREASQQRLAGVRNGIHLDLYQAAVALRSAGLCVSSTQG
jgi:cobalt-zinc-cadmium efflux system outer membrane protein